MLILILFIFLLGSFYFSCLPHFIQGGDTAELVASAHQLLVPHPPGYPLWTWIQHTWLHLFQFDTPFWRASVLNLFFSVATLFILGLPLRKSPVLLLICVVPLSLTTTFSEMSILPEVFSLHALFIASIGSLYLFIPQESPTPQKLKQIQWRQFGIPFLFTLGLSHHLTLIFLSPLVFSVFWSVLRESRKEKTALLRFLGGGALGLSITCFLYLSLLWMHPESEFSWGHVVDIPSVLQHFLRKDYGFLRMSALSQAEYPSNLKYFFKVTGIELLGLIVFCAALFISLYRQDKINLIKQHLGLLLTFLSTIILSLLFFHFTHLNPVGVGAETLKRFHLMPAILITLLSTYLVHSTLKKNLAPRNDWAVVAAGLLLTLPFTILLTLSVLKLRSLPKDSIIEDYVYNLLHQAERFGSGVILADEDAPYFGIHYVQSVYGEFQNIAVVSPSLLFQPYYLEKIQKIVPDFQLPRNQEILETVNLDIEKDIILPNLGKVALITTKGFQASPNYQVTYLKLGRLLTPGKGVAFDEHPEPDIYLKTHFDGSKPYRPQAYTKGLLYARYSQYQLAKGLFAYQQASLPNGLDHSPNRALKEWDLALTHFPFAFPALYNICKIKKDDPRCTDSNYENVLKMSQGLY